ncbi:metallocarboxypeptidase [Fragilaria crotonensis]|nr:metallocarboxypeptidase [Fragilaria crotonensis]
MLNYTEIHLVVQSNPDGRQVAETNRGAWRRKNLNPGRGKCGKSNQGVDLNRNFPFRWGLSSGSSSDECSETFRGSAAGSEPEVKAIMQRHSTTPNGNAAGFGAITDKIQQFTKYGLNIGYLSSGASVDYSYGLLGAAGISFELGNTFYQDCTTFENTILPKNFKTLTYLAKITKAPFSMAKGPDVTKLTTTMNGNILTVVATASDSALSYGKIASSKQGVRNIRAFINTHPYSLPTMNASTARYVLKNGNATTIDVSSLASGSRNVLYVQATDTAGYRGPVTAAYFSRV